ncbi:hypothetical protein J2W27_004589 [Variovorax boronicumulans]|uniref:polysaccharide deacetylase family protein n=1 Tax=Variovorax boronicumulans TaxID=436515 RepID=UPI0027870414|nr:polysaccharide deacetylase family protein [Variovorax boronicumulans]MDP9912463.1 hypothetical protein [Variovorax boronicumulans]
MICLTFDNFGCVAALPPCPFPEVVPASEWAAYNRIGLEIGHPRILQLLRQLGIRATFFAEGYAAILHPQEVLRWRDAGHEIGLHGWKHEEWSTVVDEEQENHLVDLAVTAMGDLLGDRPIGFRPPGLRINPWTDAVLERHGIRYVGQDPAPEPDPRMAALGRATGAGERPLTLTRHALLPCSNRRIDGDLIAPAYGGIFGTLDGETSFARYHEMALAHEARTPDKPWVFIAHPFISGHRAWFGFDNFVRRLAAELGPGAFVSCREALGV